MYNNIIHFTACGLLYDAIGVLLLGFAFFFKTKETLIKEAGTYWDSNPHILKSIIASKFDGMTGTLLLFIGFIYQAMGYANIEQASIVIGSYMFLIFFLAVYFSRYRSRKINEWLKELLEKSSEA
jgi:hypothetical protein